MNENGKNPAARTDKMGDRVIMEKNGSFGVLGVLGNETRRYDPRCGKIERSKQSDACAAQQQFTTDIRTSLKNGWRIVHWNAPLYG